MRVLSIDPGHSTGVAVFNDVGELEFSLVLADGAWDNASFLGKLSALARPDAVVVEGIPSKQVDDKTAARYHQIVRWFQVAGYKTHIVQPSQWKGLVSRVKIPGQHAMDAASMGKWFIEGYENGKR